MQLALGIHSIRKVENIGSTDEARTFLLGRLLIKERQGQQRTRSPGRFHFPIVASNSRMETHTTDVHVVEVCDFNLINLAAPCLLPVIRYLAKRKGHAHI